MDREKQIEEMCEIIASMICEAYNPLCDENKPHTCSRCYANSTKIGDFAEMLYNAGYRKQSEGEWIKSKSGLYVCSECDKTCPYDAQADDISYWECKYCPNCGAKMKGGTE